MSEKSELMQKIIDSKGSIRECFTHEHYGQFDVTMMRSAAEHGMYGKPVIFPWYPESEYILAYLMQYRDWEKERIRELLESGDYKSDPVLMVKHEDHAYTLIDGIHRLIGRWVSKLPTFYAYVIALDNVIRPTDDYVQPEWGDQWGRMRVSDGKLVDKDTGEVLTAPPPPSR